MFNVSGRHAAFTLGLAAIVLLSSNATVAIVTGIGQSFVWFSFLSSLVTVGVLLLTSGWRWMALFQKIRTDKWFWVAIILKLINDLAFYFAVIESRSIEATIIVYLYPVLNVLVGAYLLDQRYARLSRREWALLAVAFASVVLITPISGLSDLSPGLFAAAGISALASVYVVLVQVVADRAELPKEQESDLISLIFVGSAVGHAVVLAMLAIVPNPAANELVAWPVLSLPLLAGIVWIGLAVNIVSEALWLRAARLYNAISLKSLFYLSPVLGACYLAAFGIDEIDPVIAFCLTGVVASNFLIHQDQIDDVSYAAFLFGLVAATVLLQLVPAAKIIETFAISSDAFQTQITFVSILAGFIVFKAFEIYQTAWVATYRLIRLSAQEISPTKEWAEILQTGFDKLVVQPDLLTWEIDDTNPNAEHLSAFSELMRRDAIRDAYYDFFCARLSGLSRPERFLIYIVCLTAIPSTLAQSVSTGNGAFISAFSAALFLFLPVFVDDQVKFRSGRPLHGIAIRRAIRLVESGTKESVPIARTYILNQRNISTLTVGITAACFLASWWLLEG